MPRHANFLPNGVIPAILLPFNDDLSIDERSFRAHIRDVGATEGISALTINAHSTEVASCTFDEQRRVLDITQDEIGDRLPLVHGIWADGSLEAARIAKMAAAGGASALLVFPPAPFTMGQNPDMAIAHFRRIADATDLPLIAFQYPLATGQGYPKDTLLAMCDAVPTIRAIKDWSNNVPQHEWHVRSLQALSRPVTVLSTHSAWLLPSLVLGCNGLLSGSGSVIADLQARLFHAVQSNDLAEARRLNDRINPTARVFYADPAVDMHNRMKEALVLLGKLPRAVVRSPLVKIKEAEIARIRLALIEAGLLDAKGQRAARIAKTTAKTTKKAKRPGGQEMRVSRYRIWTAGAALALLGSIAHAQEPAKDPVKIGFVTELTGPWAFFGTSCVAGLKLAEAQLNPPGKRKIEFVTVDNQTQPAQAVAAARNLDAQSKVLALSGPTSSDTALAMYGYAEQSKVPFLVPVAAFPQLTKPGTHYTFRIEPDAAGWGYAIAQFVAKTKPGAKVALLYSDFALMRAIAAGLKYSAAKAGIKVEPEILFPQGSNDATVQAAQVLAAAPDYVVPIGAGGFDNTITNQLLDIGIKPDQIIHPYGITTQVKGWGKRSVGSYYGTFFNANLDELTPEGKQFVEQFRKQNDRPPSYIENYCYVTAQIFREALDKHPEAADDREKFRDALSELKTKETTSGIPISFDKNGARKEYIYYMQLKDVDAKDYKAKQVFYTEWDPEVIPVYELVK